MNLLKLAAKLVLDGSDFKAGMKEAQKISHDTSKEIVGHFKQALAGYFGYEALKHTTYTVAEHAIEIKHMAEQYSVTTDEVQRLGASAKGVGKTFDDFGTMLLKMGGARKDAIESNKELRETFAKYGITLDELNDSQLRNVDLLKKMAQATKGMKLTQADRENFKEIFGKSAPKLLEALSQFDESKPIELMEQDQIERVDEAHKKLVELGREMEARLLPAIAHSAEGFNKFLTLMSTAEGRRKYFLHTSIKEMESDAGPVPVSADHPNPRSMNPVGPGLPENKGELYKDKIAIGEKNAADKAELELRRAILETEVKRGGLATERAQLEKEMAGNLQVISEIEGRLAKSDVDREFVAELRLENEKSRQRLIDMDRRQADLIEMKTGGVDELTRRGQLTGGSLFAAMHRPKVIDQALAGPVYNYERAAIVAELSANVKEVRDSKDYLRRILAKMGVNYW